MKTRNLLIALLAMFALIAAGCGDDDDTTAQTGDVSGNDDDSDATDPTGGDDAADVADGPEIKIGAQDFGESAILAQIYGQALEEEGYEVEQVSVGGFRDLLLGAYDSGEVNFSPEYAASMLEFLNEQAGEATSDAAETVDKLQPRLEELGLVALEPSEAVDTNAFVITQETSDDLGIESLSDLAEKGQDLTLGGPQDCETNPFCIPGLLDVYGLDLSGRFVALDAGLVAGALEGGEIDVALLFSTDGRIADNGWVLLEDDEEMLAADNVVPVLSEELVDAYGEDLTSFVDSISAELTTEALIELNKRFDVDKEDADDIAADWIAENL